VHSDLCTLLCRNFLVRVSCPMLCVMCEMMCVLLWLSLKKNFRGPGYPGRILCLPLEGPRRVKKSRPGFATVLKTQ